MRWTIAYSKIKKRNLVLIDNDTHQRETLSERPIQPPLKCISLNFWSTFHRNYKFQIFQCIRWLHCKFLNKRKERHERCWPGSPNVDIIFYHFMRTNFKNDKGQKRSKHRADFLKYAVSKIKNLDSQMYFKSILKVWFDNNLRSLGQM